MRRFNGSLPHKAKTEQAQHATCTSTFAVPSSSVHFLPFLPQDPEFDKRAALPALDERSHKIKTPVNSHSFVFRALGSLRLRVSSLSHEAVLRGAERAIRLRRSRANGPKTKVFPQEDLARARVAMCRFVLFPQENSVITSFRELWYSRCRT